MEQKIRFGLVAGRLAVLKISTWAVKYATFEGNVFIFYFFYFFFNIVLSALKSCKVINRQYFHRKTGLKCFLTFSLEFPSAKEEINGQPPT